MSHIYISEPSTNGKILLQTTVGDLDIELWSRECPLAARNFIQLCMEGYYNNLIFHRIVKGFIAQGGDPAGDGTGGESIYGAPFKDEFHSRLRFNRRGLVAMANSGPNDNGSQFFITLGATPELQNQNTVFGKITGDTIYNILKFEDIPVDHNDRPFHAPTILRAEILNNPFDDIVPRKRERQHTKEKKKKEKGVKNFGLLSFGEEAEVDEIQTDKFVKENAGKAKSMHDLAEDPGLSKSVVAIVTDETDVLEGDNVAVTKDDSDAELRMKRIKDKFKSKSIAKKVEDDDGKKGNSDNSADELDINDAKKRKQEKNQKLNMIRNEIIKLRKDYQETKQKDLKAHKESLKKEESDRIEKEKQLLAKEQNELVKNFYEDQEKYASKKSTALKKGAERDEFNMKMLQNFREKLATRRQMQIDKVSGDSNQRTNVNDDTVEKDINGDEWLGHTLQCQIDAPILAKDASTKDDDWYDVYDPRNPINKRKRGEYKNKPRKR